MNWPELNRRQAIGQLAGCAGALALPFAAHAQSAGAAGGEAGPLDRLCAEAMMLAGVPAVAVGWTSPHGADYAVRGNRGSDPDLPVAIGDQWHIGSITKSMTALMLARLVSADSLRWTSQLGELLPDIAAALHPAIAKATLAALVTGRSGMISTPPLFEALAFPRFEDDPRRNRIAFAKLAGARPPEPLSADGFVYPNSAFIAAAAMAERATGQRWEDLVRQEVLEPLNLSSAHFGPPPQICGHRKMGERLVKFCADRQGADNPAVWRPSGGVHLSIADFAAYAAVHARRGRTRRGRAHQNRRRRERDYLANADWTRLHTPPADSIYAYGLIRFESGLLFHNGSNGSWYAEMFIDPETQCSAVAVGSSGNCESAIRQLATAALKIARSES